MGLDMYLEKINRNAVGYMDVDVSELDTDSALYNKLQQYIVKRGGPYFSWPSLFEEVGYWRKANAIHRWFVLNVQNGEDDCDRYEVSKDKLEELLSICEQVVSNAIMVEGKIVNGQTLKDGKWEDILEDGMFIINKEVCEELLPTVDGFFFGSTNYDQWYLDDVKDTIVILRKVLAETDFDDYKIYYCSSW